MMLRWSKHNFPECERLRYGDGGLSRRAVESIKAFFDCSQVAALGEVDKLPSDNGGDGLAARVGLVNEPPEFRDD